MSTCFLIATKDGEGVIAESVFHASTQGDVYVVSDGSSDRSAEVAREAGAQVYELTVNLGKPNALREAFDWFRLELGYDSIVILDDDTRLDPRFLSLARQKLGPGVAAVCGDIQADKHHSTRWNWLCAGRALAYWRYGLFIKAGQNALNCISVLPGSNTLFDIEIFDTLVHEPVTVIVDDTQWLMEIQTRKLGRVTYERRARAYIQDPTTLPDFYKQMHRWIGGTFQGIRKWKIGRSMSWFSLTYSALILDWLLYVLAWPALSAWVGWHAWHSGRFGLFVTVYLAGYAVWALIGAIALRRWRLALLFPTLIAFDWLQRIIFVHAFFWAWKNPTSECVWKSPARVSSKGGT